MMLSMHNRKASMIEFVADLFKEAIHPSQTRALPCCLTSIQLAMAQTPQAREVGSWRGRVCESVWRLPAIESEKCRLCEVQALGVYGGCRISSSEGKEGGFSRWLGPNMGKFWRRCRDLWAEECSDIERRLEQGRVVCQVFRYVRLGDSTTKDRQTN